MFAPQVPGVMYILAKNDDSCTVKNTSKYFGCKRELMDTYVVFNRVDTGGNAICLPTKTLFAINKIGDRLGIDPYDYIYPEYQEETTWMHVDDILRARTKNVNSELACIVVYTSDGNSIILKKSKKLEAALDKQFNPN